MVGAQNEDVSTAAPDPDEQWAKWQEDVAHVKNHVVRTFNRRYLFREVRQMFVNNQPLHDCGGYVFEWLQESYGHYVVMRVRQELEKNSDAPTLNELLHSILRRPEVFSRTRYIANCAGDSSHAEEWINRHKAKLRDEDFTRLAGPGGFIDPAVVKKDLKLLDRKAKQVRQYANRVVAHRTFDEVQLTIAQVDAALDQIETLLQKYYALLTGSSLMGAEPAIQFYWNEPFTMAWMPRPEE